MTLLTTLVPALIPALTDGARALIGRVFGTSGAQPQNVAETIQLMQAQTERVRALAELDKLPDGASQWVINFRGVFRYVAVGGIVASTLAATFAGVPQPVLLLLYDLTGSSLSFIIGERMYLNLKGPKQ